MEKWEITKEYFEKKLKEDYSKNSLKIANKYLEDNEKMGENFYHLKLINNNWYFIDTFELKIMYVENFVDDLMEAINYSEDIKNWLEEYYNDYLDRENLSQKNIDEFHNWWLGDTCDYIDCWFWCKEKNPELVEEAENECFKIFNYNYSEVLKYDYFEYMETHTGCEIYEVIRFTLDYFFEHYGYNLDYELGLIKKEV